MTERYPGYDVLAKRNGMSWNEVTRRVIADRLAVPREPRFFNAAQWRTLERLCARILPQPSNRPPIPLPSYIDEKMLNHGERGTRVEPMPYVGAAWRQALEALEVEAQAACGKPFHEFTDLEADALLGRMQEGELKSDAWREVPPKLFFAKRVLPDIAAAYYAHPTAWNEIGFGGPASPRGYVRMEADRHDPWEATEAKPGQEEKARRENRRVG